MCTSQCTGSNDLKKNNLKQIISGVWNVVFNYTSSRDVCVLTFNVIKTLKLFFFILSDTSHNISDIEIHVVPTVVRLP